MPVVQRPQGRPRSMHLQCWIAARQAAPPAPAVSSTFAKFSNVTAPLEVSPAHLHCADAPIDVPGGISAAENNLNQQTSSSGNHSAIKVDRKNLLSASLHLREGLGADGVVFPKCEQKVDPGILNPIADRDKEHLAPLPALLTRRVCALNATFSSMACFSNAEMQWLYANAVVASVPAQPACAPPRKRNRQPRPKPYAHTQAASASPSSSSQSLSSSASPSSSSSSSTPPPTAKRWPCGMPGCTKSYGRSHDLVRHLDTAHHAALDGAADNAILAAGVPPNQVARVRELIARRNACAVCGEAFSRRDALVRHMDEQGHRIVAPAPPAPVVAVPPVAPPPGFQWALVPVPVEEAAPLPVQEAAPPPPPPPVVDLDAGLFMSPLDMHLAPLAFDGPPAAPLLRDEDLFAFPEVGAADALAVPDMPSLDDWETLISSWAHAQP